MTEITAIFIDFVLNGVRLSTNYNQCMNFLNTLLTGYKYCN